MKAVSFRRARAGPPVAVPVTGRRGGVALDDPEAESGRGPVLLDLLAPARHIQRWPIGKQVRCRPAHPAG